MHSQRIKYIEFYLFVSLFIIVLINEHLFALAVIAHTTHTMSLQRLFFSQWMSIYLRLSHTFEYFVFIEKMQSNNKPYPRTICETTTNAAIESCIEMNKLKKWAYRNVERKRKRSSKKNHYISFQMITRREKITKKASFKVSIRKTNRRRGRDIRDKRDRVKGVHMERMR